jgi:tetratricopeptide (TPR) repeat protein
MSKLGRNEPCPCGSGKKYKKCCEVHDQQLAAEHIPQNNPDGSHSRSHAHLDLAHFRHALDALLSRKQAELDELTDRVNDLIDTGRLDEAEPLARQLEADFPEEPVGAEFLALICEARGQHQTAADHYRRAVAAMDALGEGNFCDCCRSRMVDGAIRLDPAGPALPTRTESV